MAVRSSYSKSAVRREYEVSEMVGGDYATKHGVIVYLSAINCSKSNLAVKYINAKIGDGKKVC